MKNIVFIVAVLLMAGSAGAGHMIMEDRQGRERSYPDSRMEGYRYFRWVMHGPGAPGYGCGNGNDSYMENKPGMVGYDMAPGMAEYDAKKNKKFLKETVDIRRELHNRQFDYNEALRNSDVKHDDIIKMKREILELQMKIRKIWRKRID